MILTKEANVFRKDRRTVVIQNDARSLPLPDESIDLIITSPPYWSLRTYKDNDGESLDGQIGTEDTPTGFLEALDECMTEWRRVIKPSGSVWMNLGDKFAGSGGSGNQSGVSGKTDLSKEEFDAPKAYNKAMMDGMRRKSLMGIPWRFAIRQIDAGWILRAEVIWKKNGLPDPVTDRVRRDHEQWFHFTKAEKYFANLDPIREPYRIPGSVWEIGTDPFRITDEVRDFYNLSQHHAAFPQELPRRIILGWSPEKGTVLDPFGGTGTVAGVARILGRYGISNDLSAAYCRLASWRVWESGHFRKAEKRTWADKQMGFE